MKPARVTTVFPPVVVMGVSGCGKSTVGRALADAWHCRYLEGDEFHTAANIARMAAGVPLTDADRHDWLHTLAAELARARRAGDVVLSCSALKRSYRDILRSGAPDLAFVHLAGTPELLTQRMAQRTGHYMPASLLASQLDTLESPQADERAITLDVAQPPDALARAARAWLEAPA